MKLLLVTGTRPQFIKASILLNALDKLGGSTVFIHTGQHYDNELSGAIFEELNIKTPDYNLGVGSGNYKYQINTGVSALLEVIHKESPAVIVTIGDSTPAIVGCLAALSKAKPLFHIEAGLRSGNIAEPEERNRILVDSLSDYLFCSTQECLENLEKEKASGNVLLTGDLLYDAWKWGEGKEYKPLSLKDYDRDNFCLLTLHRSGNIYDHSKLYNIINFIANKWCVPTVWPIHPGVRKKLIEIGMFEKLKQNSFITLIPSVTYLEMKWFLNHCFAVVTDSVGVQVEAFLAKKLSFVIRNETEYKELIENGWSKRFDPNDTGVKDCLKAVEDYKSIIPDKYNENLFGDGYSAIKIAESIMCFSI